VYANDPLSAVGKTLVGQGRSCERHMAATVAFLAAVVAPDSLFVVTWPLLMGWGSLEYGLFEG